MADSNSDAGRGTGRSNQPGESDEARDVTEGASRAAGDDADTEEDPAASVTGNAQTLGAGVVGASVGPLAAAEFGQEIGRFRVVKRLGEGGMGVVYAAYDPKRRATVALKTLINPQPVTIFRLKNEFRALQEIDHPNLVTMGELFEENGQWFLTMELIDGNDFVTYVRGNVGGAMSAASFDEVALPPPLDRDAPRGGSSPDHEARPFADADSGAPEPAFDEKRLRRGLAQLVRGLEALHRSGRVHRDIKPANILVTKDERVVLLDFGLVSRVEPGIRSTDRQCPVGTAAYMAPEQASDSTVGPEADWYALGVILYDSLTGQLPFTGTALQILLAKQDSVPQEPREIADHVPEDLNALCMALLKPAPSERAGADEVKRCLLPDSGGGSLPTSTTATRGTALVGRDRELQTLFAAFKRLRQAVPACVLLHGGSGLGKSEILRVFGRRVREEAPDTVVLFARCFERESVPFKALDSIVDELSLLLRRMPHAEAMQLVPRNAGLLARVFPVLGYVHKFGDGFWSGRRIEDLHEVRRRAFKALRELLARLADRHPVVLIIDDFQWADEDSLRLLRTVLQPPDAPVMLLLTALRTPAAKSEERAAVAAAAAAFPADLQEVEIRPLCAEDARALATMLIGEELPDGGRRAQAEQIGKESDGHPLFIQELVHHVLEKRATVGALQLDEVLMARIAALDPQQRATLELTSIAEAPIRYDLLADVLGTEPAQLHDLVTKLKLANLLRSRGTQMSDALEPYHDRVREATLAALPSAVRRNWHERLAQALEASGQAEPENLAHHLEECGQRAKAARLAAEAARRATDLLAFEHAASLYRRALRLWAAPDSADEPAPDLRELRVRLGEVLVNACRGREAAEEFLAAVPGADALEAIELEQRAAGQFLLSGHVDQGIETTRQVFAALGMSMPRTPGRALLSLIRRRLHIRLRGVGFKARDAAEIPDEELVRIDICRSLSVGLAVVDNIRGADFSTRYVLFALNAGETGRIAHALALEANFVAGAGGAGSRYYRKVVASAEALLREKDDVMARAYLVGSRAYGAFMAGRWSVAKELAQQALTHIGPAGTSWEYATMRLITLWSLYYLGELEELRTCARPWIEQALERGDFFTAAGMLMGRPNIVFLGQDDPDRARHEVEQMLGQWNVKDYHLQHYHALLALAHIDLYTGESVRANERVTQEWTKLRHSRLLMLPSVKYEALHLRARVALAVAPRVEPGERKRLLGLVRRNARRLLARKLAWTKALSLLLQAGLAAQCGRHADAVATLESAIARLDAADMRLYAAAGRMRLGALVGGDAGESHLAAGRGFMAEQGVRNAERLAAVLAPGLTP